MRRRAGQRSISPSTRAASGRRSREQLRRDRGQRVGRHDQSAHQNMHRKAVIAALGDGEDQPTARANALHARQNGAESVLDGNRLEELYLPLLYY